MITVRRAAERGHFDHGWLDTRHSFSFGAYRDPQHMGYRSLRVLNEDRVAPGSGFPRHGHADMEILSYVLTGGLAHEDSLGRRAVLSPSEVQLMSAGRGIQHAEFNASDEEPVHFLQIWITPRERGADPRYQQRAFAHQARQDRLCCVASPDGEGDSLEIGQDARVYVATFSREVALEHGVATGRGAWVQLARGAVAVNGVALQAGDGAAAEEEAILRLAAAPGAEILLFDLA